MSNIGAIHLLDGTTIPFNIFNGEQDIKVLQQKLITNSIDVPCYFLYVFDMWYACAFDGWRAFIIGKEDYYFLSIDWHWIKKSIKNNAIELENIPTEFGMPKYMGTKLWDYIVQEKGNPVLYWQMNNQLNLYPCCDQMKIIGSFFMTQFFAGAYFTINHIPLMLDGIFTKDMLQNYEKSFVYGVFQINPFTWRVKTGPLSAPYYAAYFDFIKQEPIISFPMNNYGKRK